MVHWHIHQCLKERKIVVNVYMVSLLVLNFIYCAFYFSDANSIAEKHKQLEMLV